VNFSRAQIIAEFYKILSSVSKTGNLLLNIQSFSGTSVKSISYIALSIHSIDRGCFSARTVITMALNSAGVMEKMDLTLPSAVSGGSH
jgi:hypothetical protein